MEFDPNFTYILIVVVNCSRSVAFARSNTGIVGSNPTQGMDIYVCVYSVFVLSCV
jgi:hypothetical protein